jgi:membrane fusion protein, copper/silver efflux system
MWQNVKLIFKVVEVRLRFIAVLVVTFVVIAKWEAITNHWHKATRADGRVFAAVRTVLGEGTAAWLWPHRAAAGLGGDREYYCPMHPSVTRDGLDPDGSVPNCPICGMPLAIHKKGQAAPLPAGVTARVQLSPQRIQLGGIQTVAVGYEPLVKELTAVGEVTFDESRRSQVVSRVEGYVEQLYVDRTWVMVPADAPLVEIYSPDLYSAVQELLLAVKRDSVGMVDSARQKLRLLGVAESEIDAIVASGKPTRGLVLRAPRGGHVTRKDILEGSHVAAGDMLLEIADLSVVWVEADVYERDLPFLREGQSIEATVEGLPGQTFSGTVALVHPHVQATTRTVQVRFELQNPGHALRPGMFARVSIRSPVRETEPFLSLLAARIAPPADADDDTRIAWQGFCPVTGRKLGSMGPPVPEPAGDKTVFLCCAGCEGAFRKTPEKYLALLAAPPADGVLAVPERAIIDTGRQKIVYVEREPGTFEGVEIEVGPRAGGQYAVLSGLSPGDRVAAAGAFLIDAETRLNPAAAAAYLGAGGGPQGESMEIPSSDEPAVEPPGDEPSSEPRGPSPEDRKNIARLPAADRAAALAQQFCPITDEPLGSMGVPVKVEVQGKAVYLCCKGCVSQAKKSAEKVLRKLDGHATKEQPVKDE